MIVVGEALVVNVGLGMGGRSLVIVSDGLLLVMVIVSDVWTIT